MKTHKGLIVSLIFLAINLAISYTLALYEHPNSLWLWRNVFGVM